MIRILTDSASDILPAEAEQLGVTVIPLNVTLEDGTVLRDGVDMTPTVYYGVMARCHKLPTTSQPSPELFQRFFLEAAAAGDEVVGIFLSHELSGTCQCARLAADMANVDNVLFVDSENVCLGESLLVRLAVQLRDAGKTAGQFQQVIIVRKKGNSQFLNGFAGQCDGIITHFCQLMFTAILSCEIRKGCPEKFRVLRVIFHAVFQHAPHQRIYGCRHIVNGLGLFFGGHFLCLWGFFGFCIGGAGRCAQHQHADNQRRCQSFHMYSSFGIYRKITNVLFILLVYTIIINKI